MMKTYGLGISGAAHSQEELRRGLLSAAWPAIWVIAINDFGWRLQSKGALVRRKCVGRQKRYLVWLVFCFPLAVWEECKQRLVKVMSNCIKPEDLSEKACMRRMIQGTN